MFSCTQGWLCSTPIPASTPRKIADSVSTSFCVSRDLKGAPYLGWHSRCGRIATSMDRPAARPLSHHLWINKSSVVSWRVAFLHGLAHPTQTASVVHKALLRTVQSVSPLLLLLHLKCTRTTKTRGNEALIPVVEEK
jgi:hypothetical protein